MPARPPSLAAVIERGFRDGVADRLTRGPFTFTDRAALLAAGRRLGIDPARGNLIIADQQRHLQRKPARPAKSPGLFAGVATFAVVQGAVIAAVVWAVKA